MAPVEINPAHVREFEDLDGFYRWLGENHATAPEIWIKIHKRASGLRSINSEEAIEAVLCWGWIDGIRKSHNEKSFFQRYCPRGRRSVWSKKNVATVASTMPQPAHTMPLRAVTGEAIRLMPRMNSSAAAK